MTEKNTLHSLNGKSLLLTMAGIGLAVLLYFTIVACGRLYIENEYMSTEAVNARKAGIHQEFSTYVNLNQLNGRNSSAVARWTEEHDYVTIYLFETGRARQSFTGGKAEPGNLPRDYDSSVYGKLYPVRFSDGIYHIAISDSSQLRQLMLLKVLAFSFGGLAFLLMHLLYTRHLTKRIIALSREAALVSAGDLWRSIEAEGGDELAQLALSMDEMRRSVIQRMGKETMAWQANSELITAISHDIRTPMTSLLGYLSFLNDGNFESSEQAGQFASSAYAKAMELKDLTDQLFRYFLVYGKAELELEMEHFDGRLLLEQFCAEAQFDLREAGFKLHVMEFEGECGVEADPAHLKRVFDNVVSNIKKYADREQPVVFMSELSDGYLGLCVSNYISRSMDRVESTKIGLRTCEKIMQSMNGSFVVRADAEHFAVEMKLPAKPSPGE